VTAYWPSEKLSEMSKTTLFFTEQVTGQGHGFAFVATAFVVAVVAVVSDLSPVRPLPDFWYPTARVFLVLKALLAATEPGRFAVIAAHVYRELVLPALACAAISSPSRRISC
jgi:hypothetical protein